MFMNLIEKDILCVIIWQGLYKYVYMVTSVDGIFLYEEVCSSWWGMGASKRRVSSFVELTKLDFILCNVALMST